MKTTFLNDLLRIIYPHICLGCGNSLHSSRDRICFSCIENLPYTNESMFTNTLNDKLLAMAPISGTYSMCYYNQDGILQELIKELKYRNQPELGVFFGELLGQKLLEQSLHVDLIIPIPLHPSRKRKRGYNQATVIAKGVNEMIKADLCANLIERATNTKSQTNQNKMSRFQNMEQVFVVQNMEELTGKTVLLIDDVITTGATVLSCSQVLLRSGVSKVFVAAIAKADTLG